MSYERGERVRYTKGPLGAMLREDGTRFLASQYNAKAGDVGYYVGPHPDLEDWHITSTKERGGRNEMTYPGPYVMVTDEMIRPELANQEALREMNGDG